VALNLKTAKTLGLTISPALLAGIDLKRRGSRRFTRYLVAILIGVAATLAWQSYGAATKRMIATWAPELGSSPEVKQMIRAGWTGSVGPIYRPEPRLPQYKPCGIGSASSYRGGHGCVEHARRIAPAAWQNSLQSAAPRPLRLEQSNGRWRFQQRRAGAIFSLMLVTGLLYPKCQKLQYSASSRISCSDLDCMAE
jgi:hypothetical protein